MKIKWTYSFKGRKTDFESDWMEKSEVLPIVNDLQKTGRVKTLSIMDELHNEWTLKEFAKLDKQLDEEPSDVQLFFDGGYNLSLNEAGIGVVIYYKKNDKNYRVRMNERLMQLESNNEAEYAALHRGVMMLEEIGVKQVPVTIFGDSNVVLKQLSGEWPCYEEVLNTWLDRIELKVKAMGIAPLYNPIDRKENKEADKLATQALEGTYVNSHSVIE
ncbi:ribonuclease HI [Bacillus ectoiniformans]|nr:ribonuclease HI [Bacillus ectoiniformans]